ncbi:transposase [Xanthomonas hyacinthi]|uniref:Transposase n=1 Tax=Xanthomonas hyacinthi TaxID=56455 RepID=A0A2S7EYF4_9XANT|nr:hypothetical protein XhyaCFBP1156_08265 [Xanthomonas hyacinthi]QGY76761.1 transposase [Xanthomonas hyacinthi]
MRRVLEHQGEHGAQWAAIGAVAGRIGGTPETLRRWVRQAEHGKHKRSGATAAELERIRRRERENRELRQANAILRKASVDFAQAELDRRLTP